MVQVSFRPYPRKALRLSFLMFFLMCPSNICEKRSKELIMHSRGVVNQISISQEMSCHILLLNIKMDCRFCVHSLFNSPGFWGKSSSDSGALKISRGRRRIFLQTCECEVIEMQDIRIILTRLDPDRTSYNQAGAGINITRSPYHRVKWRVCVESSKSQPENVFRHSKCV